MKVVALCNKLSRSRLSGKILFPKYGDDLDPSEAELIAMEGAVAPSAAGGGGGGGGGAGTALLSVPSSVLADEDHSSPRVSNMTTGKHVVVSRPLLAIKSRTGNPEGKSLMAELRSHKIDLQTYLPTYF